MLLREQRVRRPVRAQTRRRARVMMDVIDVLAVRELGASALVLHVDADNVPATRLYESIGFYDMTHAEYPPLVDVFTSEPFVTGDEGEQRIMIKPLAAIAPQAVPPPPMVAQGGMVQPSYNPMAGAGGAPAGYPPDPMPARDINRQEDILSMNRREQILDLERLMSLTN